MKALILAVFAALSLGAATANAAIPNSHAPIQQGNNFNFMQGGGG